MKITIALIGNQNAGKTTLFNQLTGSRQHVGNFPGVTVEKKSGTLKNFYNHGFQVHAREGQAVLGEEIHSDKLIEIPHGLEVELVDLPGIYSLSPYTPEERVTRDFLIHEKPDAVINILDATNIERNLYLSLQLMEMQIPMVMALNMMDEVRKSGNSIDIERLSKDLHIDIVPIAANKAEGVSELAQRTITEALSKHKPQKIDFCSGPVHKAIHAVVHLIEQQSTSYDIPLRFAATKLVEGDTLMEDALSVTANQKEIIAHIVSEMETELDTDREAALADMRYEYISQICSASVIRHGDTQEQIRSVKIDSVLTHTYFAIPIFIGIMALIFWLTFGIIGSTLSGLFEQLIEFVTGIVDSGLGSYGMSAAVHSLIIDGAFAGVGSVLSFMPTILVLFFFLSLLEDSGYMARVAFVMDSLLRKMGLSGKSIVPMLIGFGCSVPAIMATRTLSSRRDKLLTIFITPFMSCSAKLPVYALFTQVFFPRHAPLVMIGLYAGGMVIAIVSALVLKSTVFKGKPVPFVMELPAYRLPAIKSMAIHIWEKARDFLQKAFTVIFAATIVIWFFQNFDTRLNLVTDASDSILSIIGSAIAPVFRPLGFTDWRLSTALITGLTAKEAVVSTLAVLFAGEGNLELALSAVLTAPSALAFLVFILLYMPCFAALAVTKREIGTRHAIAAALFQTITAWLAAAFVYFIANLIV
jgi:ferrous iron transport protein B